MKTIQYISIIILLIGCGRSVPKENWSREKVAQEVTSMLYEYHHAIEKDGLTAEFQFLDQSADFFWVPPGYTSKLSYDSVHKILVKNNQAISSIAFKWETLEVFPLSNDIATYTGIVKGRMKDTSGLITKTAIIESGTLIRRTDGWKLLSGQSALLNGGE